MRNYATAQQTGLRDNQCDATAVYTAPSGARAYVLLDGIGSTDAVRDWTRAAAARLARRAARRGNAETGLRAVYESYAAERGAWGDYEPKAAAVVAVTTSGKPTTIAWCGDSRAYRLTPDGTFECLTRDHNLRRVYPPTDWHDGGSRNRITSCLGATSSDQDCMDAVGHPVIETATVPPGTWRLLLASDGAYEPHEDGGYDLAALATGDRLGRAARDITELAVTRSIAATRALDPSRPYADNATVLLADIAP
ncbi:PP2C family protein-serine/threonine phosphatase [Streptomyces sp. NPDC059605]|uniref:PP2C family protein-serine/threonine phosphatase n=1 Tax=Streptomyces sp. NPDC059605 TaxID=3346882 RepID=UPI0036B7FA84